MPKNLVSKVRKQIVEEQTAEIGVLYDKLTRKLWTNTASSYILFEVKDVLDMLSELAKVHGSMQGLANGYDLWDDNADPVKPDEV